MQTHVAAPDTDPNCPRSYRPFTFPGFWREGECDLTVQIRLRSVVFICSQRPDYNGTSVTNAIEAIRHKAIEQIYEDGLVMATSSRTWLEKLFLTKARATRLLKSAVRRFIEENSVWIEHYPAGTGKTWEDSYAIVYFSASGEPAWSYVTRETLQKRLPGIALPHAQGD